jgi:tetratricopeptide (TPR) repeat protein
MKYGLLIFIGWIGCCSVSYGAFECSPIVSGEAGGNVTITCEGLSEGAVKTLNELLNKGDEAKELLTLTSEKEKRLAEVQGWLSKKDDTIAKRDDTIAKLNAERVELEDSLKHLKVGVETVKLKVAEEWAQRYKEIESRLRQAEEDIQQEENESSSKQKIQLALQTGDLNEAGTLLDRLIAQREQSVDKLAQYHFDRAKVLRLEFKPTQALLHAEKAYHYHPENTEYAHVYAGLLVEQNQHAQAIIIYRQNLQQLREKGDKQRVAGTLNNLGTLYFNVQQFKEAEVNFQEALNSYEALSSYKELTKADLQVHSPDVARILNNLGVLYFNTQRFKIGEASLQEALTIYRDLAKANPQAYSSDVARTLNNLGVLYFNTHNTQRFEEAEANFQKALTIYRDLAKTNPQAYLSDVARTLNNLGVLYKDTQRLKEGEVSYQEVLTVYRDLAKANSQAYRKDLADILWSAALLYLGQGKTTEAHRYFDEAIPLYRKLWQAYPELYAKKFGENLLLNARTLPPKDTEMRCSLLEEAWQVASSEYISVIGIYQSITLLLCQLR